MAVVGVGRAIGRSGLTRALDMGGCVTGLDRRGSSRERLCLGDVLAGGGRSGGRAPMWYVTPNPPHFPCGSDPPNLCNMAFGTEAATRREIYGQPT
jgi:hypothetical protein